MEERQTLQTLKKHSFNLPALYPGSFDPMTNGHMDILKRALPLFSELTVVVAGQPQKNPLFSISERVSLIEEVIQDTKELRSRVKVTQWDGLIMEFARKHKFKAVIRGLRAASDFEYEFMMASMNKQINSDVETVFMMTSQDLFFVSSTMVKELFLYGGDISPYVPKAVIKKLGNHEKWKKLHSSQKK